MSRIILASQSPRRRELLTKMGVAFEAIPSQYDEQLDQNRDVNEVAKELALGKALDVAKQYPDAYVIGSDTIVTIHGKQLEKPVDINEARSFLVSYCGHMTPVITGVALVNLSEGIQLVDVDTTDVYFKQDNNDVHEAREAYLATGDWADKAGGYGIQSGAAPLVDHIEGDYETIKGLPTRHLSKMLKEVGIESSIVAEEPPVPQTLGA